MGYGAVATAYGAYKLGLRCSVFLDMTKMGKNEPEEIKTILNDLSSKEKKMNNKIIFDNKILKNNEVLKKSSYIIKKKPSSIKIIDKDKLIIENLPELQSQLIEPKNEEKENDFNDTHINKKINLLSNKNSFLLRIKQAKPNEHEVFIKKSFKLFINN